MLCSHSVTEGRAQGCLPTGPRAQDPPGAGATLGHCPWLGAGLQSSVPSLALGGHGEGGANAVSQPVPHVEAINHLI